MTDFDPCCVCCLFTIKILWLRWTPVDTHISYKVENEFLYPVHKIFYKGWIEILTWGSLSVSDLELSTGWSWSLWRLGIKREKIHGVKLQKNSLPKKWWCTLRESICSWSACGCEIHVGLGVGNREPAAGNRESQQPNRICTQCFSTWKQPQKASFGILPCGWSSSKESKSIEAIISHESWCVQRDSESV